MMGQIRIVSGPASPCYKTRVRGSILMQLISIAANPVPEGATVGTVKTSDGVVLRFARFDPPAGRKGTLCVFTGRAEFIEKYFEVVRDARGAPRIELRGGARDRALVLGIDRMLVSLTHTADHAVATVIGEG